MFGITRKVSRKVRDRAVYLEIYGDNKVAYRVITGRINIFGEDAVTYGIEAEDYETGEREAIPDFSRDIEDAVDFAEMLIKCKTPPKQIYSRALNYLKVSI